MEQGCPCLQRLWILEYAWAHKVMDVFQAVEALFWPEVEWVPLSLDESWRVRVLSAQVYCIVKKRQTNHYERVLGFLEHTHMLLPTLVPSIKHMKIMFGLKTLVILWMLKEGIGPINVAQKIIRFFPSKLPQYQEQCSKREMFLMRKNHLDFKNFAQSLVMDQKKLENYMQDHMEEQYGEHYAQKTEERLLHYLHDLNKTLPKDTYIDTLLKKNSPVKEEEKLLLDIITHDSDLMATTLKTPLHCNSAFCYSRMRSCWSSESPACASYSQHLTKSTSKRSSQLMTVGQVYPTDVAKDGPRKEQTMDLQTDKVKDRKINKANITSEKEADNVAMGEIISKSALKGRVSPHFCSKHQRWVRNILCECPEESSEDQQVQDSQSSPPLFLTSSSSDLTPSNLTLPPECHQSNYKELQKIIEDDLGTPSYPAAPPVLSSISRGSVLKVVLVPLEHIMPSYTSYKTSDTSQTSLPTCSNQDPATKSSTFSQFTISTNSSLHQTQIVNATTFKPSFSRLSTKFRLPPKSSQLPDTDNLNYENKKSEEVQVSPQESTTLIDKGLSIHITSVTLSSYGTPRITSAHFHLEAEANPSVACCAPDHVTMLEGVGALRSSRMQPCVVLKRMSVEECLEMTSRGSHPRKCDDMEQSDCTDSSFDVNQLYSSGSSEEEANGSDPEYKPHRNVFSVLYQ